MEKNTKEEENKIAQLSTTQLQNKYFVLAVVVIVLAVALSGLLIYRADQEIHSPIPVPEVQAPVTNEPVNTEQPSENTPKEPPVSNNPTQGDTGPTGNKYIDAKTLGVDVLTVDWIKGSPVEETKKNQDDPTKRFYLGKVSNSGNQGAKLYIRATMELGYSYTFELRTPTETFDLDSNVKIAGVNTQAGPEEIEVPGVRGKLKLVYSIQGVATSLFPKVKMDDGKVYDSYSVFYKHPVVGNLYKSETLSNCLTVVLPSHLLALYQPETSPVATMNPNDKDYDYKSGNVSFKIKDGKTVSGRYNVYHPTCGGGCVEYNLINYFDGKFSDNIDDQLELFGSNSDGERYYRFKDNNNQTLREMYNTGEFTMYNSDGNTQVKKYSYAQFLAKNPLIFWKDAYGNWVFLKQVDFVPQAEMCKPAVYLYPMTTTDLNVHVSPPHGVSVSIPEYGTGWHVTASPDGTIINQADHKQYPYLFWEGVGYGSPTLDSAYVVESKNLNTFFEKVLSEYSLNKREREDFKNYWVPKLSGFSSPYFAISFDTTAYTQHVPISVSPISPDTQIRLLMKALPLSAPTNFKVPAQITPVSRDGFTLVEWGGSIIGQ